MMESMERPGQWDLRVLQAMTESMALPARLDPKGLPEMTAQQDPQEPTALMA